MAREEIHFRHWQRVRQRGFNGPRGRMVRCPSKRRPGTFYFKVKLDSGQWEYPRNVVADTDGKFTFSCEDCHIPFRTNDPAVGHCPQCDPTEQMEADLQHEPTRRRRRSPDADAVRQATANVVGETRSRVTPPRRIVRRDEDGQGQPLEPNPFGD